LQGQEKMSKSDPNSAIFMEDSEGDVNVKIKKAFCPPQVRDCWGLGYGFRVYTYCI
jgi:tyrosyl-tRNA synthetase